MTEGLLFVYVMHSGGLRKIGFSANPYIRITMLKSPSGAPITVEFVAPHAASLRHLVEQQTHNHLRGKRVSGEWFYVSASEARTAVLRNVIMYDDAWCFDDLQENHDQIKQSYHERFLQAHRAIGVVPDPLMPVWFPDPDEPLSDMAAMIARFQHMRKTEKARIALAASGAKGGGKPKLTGKLLELFLSEWADPKAGTNIEVAERHGITVKTAAKYAGMSRREAIRRADRARHDKGL